MNTSPPAIHVRGLTKSYSTGGSVTPALRGVDLDVQQGELLMLVGPSGCGKTTLISVIAGILNQDGGECVVYGSELSKLSDREKTAFRGSSIGFVFQAYNLIPTLTAQENVAVPLLIAGRDRLESLKRAGEILRAVGLEEKLHSRPGQLSGGQQQRVATARALIHEPKLIVCDEPTSALDSDTGQKIMSLFREVALKGGRTLVIVTHDSRIFHFADRIARMDDGRIESIENGRPHEWRGPEKK
jgi:putative ABC transport system ATP-binding protein